MFPRISIPNTTCFKQIKIKNEKNWTVPITLEYWNNLHKDGLKCLFNIIEKNNNIKKHVIITHYPLTMNGTSNPIYYKDDIEVKKNFSNEIDLTFDNQFINICGHTHYNFDFTKNNIRYISNQYGYDLSQRNNFKEDLVFYLFPNNGITNQK